MAIGTQIVSDTLTTATTQSLFTFAPSNWVALNTTSFINIGANGVGSTTGGSGFYNGAVRLGSTFTNDQYAQGTFYSVFTAGGGNFGLGLRMSTASNGSGYILTFGNNAFLVYRLVNGANTQLANIPVTVTAGDQIYFQVVGIILRVFQNGKLIWQFMDWSVASGVPGLGSGSAAYASSNILYNWAAGNAIADPVVFPGWVTTGAPTQVTTGSFTANTWKTITVSSDPSGGQYPPPTGTTGLIMQWNTNNATTFRFTTRNTGSTFNTMPPAGTENTGEGQQGIVITPCKFVAGSPPTFNFDIQLSTVGTGFTLWGIGYLGPETVWIDPPVMINPTGTMTTTTPYVVNWSTAASIPACAAVICDVWGAGVGLLPANAGAGEMTKWLGTGSGSTGSSHQVLCGYGTGTANFVADNSSIAPTIVVRGYMKSGIVWEPTAFDVSPGATGTSYPALSSAAFAAPTTNALLYQGRGAATVNLLNYWATGAVQFGPSAPANGQAQMVQFTNYPNTAASVRLVTSGTLPFTLGEQAYFVGSPLPTSPTSAKGIITVRSTSQS